MCAKLIVWARLLATLQRRINRLNLEIWLLFCWEERLHAKQLISWLNLLVLVRFARKLEVRKSGGLHSFLNLTHRNLRPEDAAFDGIIASVRFCGVLFFLRRVVGLGGFVIVVIVDYLCSCKERRFSHFLFLGRFHWTLLYILIRIFCWNGGKAPQSVVHGLEQWGYLAFFFLLEKWICNWAIVLLIH